MEYKSVSLPLPLLNDVEQYVALDQLGYSSVPEFIKDACRRRMDEIRRNLRADCAVCRKNIPIIDGEDSDLGLICKECASVVNDDAVKVEVQT